ncbi:hypothetical protein AKJ62_03580 [candidate division MSBL1 archaeon SCGC-AAA259D14]|uniref:4Fe-4S ferredoxin-type domain-containing protein n=1 Tax=candidate division MSBL1 archaeon SCGC-AAA259D14 TaxID=1698261 RepID=A0A133U4V9_9EURY|nr:hypothetical protein AKJ62_03580 [candidate division MSBL1 archaeon SCGC-AAA259D14]
MGENILKHLKAIATGIKYLFSSKRQTCSYPATRQKVNERYRGMIKFNGELCVSCGICARVCPANAIKLRTGVKEEPSLDYARCIFCGFCVESCPASALENAPLHDLVYTNYDQQFFEPEELTEADKDPYEVPDGVVEVKIDEDEGFLYES